MACTPYGVHVKSVYTDRTIVHPLPIVRILTFVNKKYRFKQFNKGSNIAPVSWFYEVIEWTLYQISNISGVYNPGTKEKHHTISDKLLLTRYYLSNVLVFIIIDVEVRTEKSANKLLHILRMKHTGYTNHTSITSPLDRDTEQHNMLDPYWIYVDMVGILDILFIRTKLIFKLVFMDFRPN